MTTSSPMCDTHDSDLAQALCLNHRRLMCFSCALKEATSSQECVVKEIRDLDEKQALILRCLLLRQTASRKERLICEHEKKTAELKKDIEQKVMETYDKLNNRLTQLKDNCLDLLDRQAHNIIQSNEDSKQRLLSFQKSNNETIDKLSEESVDDITDMERQLNKIETDIIKKIEDKKSIVEGSFQENFKLVEAIMQSGTNLCTVSLIQQDHYAVINDNLESKTDTSQKSIIYMTSDEVHDESQKTTISIGDTTNDNVYSQQNNGKGKEGATENSTVSNQNVEPQRDRQKDQGGKGIFSRLFSSGAKTKSDAPDKNKRKKSETKEGEHKKGDKALEEERKTNAESTFYEPKGSDPKHLINKTVHVSELKKADFPTALKFSKLIHFGDSYIGMVSETHNSIVIVGLDGKFFGKKTFKGGKISVCDIGNYMIATVQDPSCQIDKFKVSNEGLKAAGSVVTSEQMSNITGFEFDVSSSKFAVSTPEKVIVLDKVGKAEKVTPYNSTSNLNPDDFATLFHFEKECLYILNIRNKTLKMFSFKKKSDIWKRKIDSNDFTPKCMCLYEDKLCITCGNSIAIFSASSGEPLVKYETNDLLEDCFGLCVIDSVIVFSSCSNDFETSTKLSYISV